MRKLLIALLVLSPALLSAQLKLEIQRLSSDKYFVDCEPIMIRVTWTNTLQEELFVGPEHRPTHSDAISIWVNGQKASRRANGEAITYPPDYDTLKPGESISSDFDFRDVYSVPGTYTVKAVADFSRFPVQAFPGRVAHKSVDRTESSSVEVVIERATGENLEALVYATKHKEYSPYLSSKEQACFLLNSPFSDTAQPIFEKFPTSNYVGWMIWQIIYYHGQHENPERDVHKPADVVQIALGQKEFWPKGSQRKNCQLTGCARAFSLRGAAMEKLIPVMSEGEPWSSVAECLAEQYLLKKQFDKAILLFKIAKDHPRGKEFLDAIREHMPEYIELLDK
jgi:hypothetical protein